MKILFLHCDYIKFKPLKKALKSISDLPEKDKKKKEVKDCLVIFVAVEKGDGIEIVKELSKNVKDVAKEIKVKKLVLYPYAHLARDLASPEIASSVFNEAEKVLSKDFDVTKAPFGYYKEFELKVKGHPLSELSREIRSESILPLHHTPFSRPRFPDKQLTIAKSFATHPKEGINIEEQINRDSLLKKMSKVKMSALKSAKGLKSNVELGRDLDLYIVSEIVGAGLPLLTPKGATIKREIERFIVDEELKRGYLHVSTPFMAKSELYKVSGHWQHYKDNMFTLNVRGEDFALRPMTCPFHFVLYKSRPRGYKELPIKYAEVATLFRNEKTGELRGLTRVRQFTLADAHIICTEEQVENEFKEVLELIKFVMSKLGIKDTWYRFSRWDSKNKEKYIDNPRAWENSERLMKKILSKLKVKYIEAKDEAAFYGPKLDLQYKDVYGKEDTLITVQVDFALPERFDLAYNDKDNKEKRPYVIHRSSTGATERVISYLLEKTQGNLPLWLNPVQVKILNMTDRNLKYAEKVLEELKKEGVRVESDFSAVPISKKVRDAQLEKVYYMITVGDKEEKGKTLAIRTRDGKVKFGVKLERFVDEIKKEINDRR